jgi:hypothetical protein
MDQSGTLQFCKLSLLSCGSHGSIRFWKFQKDIGLVSSSSQEQRAKVRRFKTTEVPDAITGVRTVCSGQNKYVDTGLDPGFLNVLDDKLRVQQSIPGNSASVMSMTIQGQFLALDGNNGMTRIYKIVGKG